MGGYAGTDCLTAGDLREVLGVAPEVARDFICSISDDACRRQSISFAEFFAVVCGEVARPGSPHTPVHSAVGAVGDAVAGLLDNFVNRTPQSSPLLPSTAAWSRATKSPDAGEPLHPVNVA